MKHPLLTLGLILCCNQALAYDYSQDHDDHINNRGWNDRLNAPAKPYDSYQRPREYQPIDQPKLQPQRPLAPAREYGTGLQINKDRGY